MTLNYVNQWWPSSSTEAGASPVSVTSGVTTPDIDATMATGGMITGPVTDSPRRQTAWAAAWP